MSLWYFIRSRMRSGKIPSSTFCNPSSALRQGVGALAEINRWWYLHISYRAACSAVIETQGLHSPLMYPWQQWRDGSAAMTWFRSLFISLRNPFKKHITNVCRHVKSCFGLYCVSSLSHLKCFLIGKNWWSLRFSQLIREQQDYVQMWTL